MENLRNSILLIFMFTIVTTSCKKQNYKEQGLQKLEDFGVNEGNLNAFYYEPVGATSNMPLLVVLHGCSQNALGIAELSDWNKLADEYGFYILYPEQKTINNASKCFNWFQAQDFEKNKGENASILEMMAKMETQFNIITQQTFITGISAGGAMSMVMISVYPNKFKGAAIMSGVPFKAANNVFTSISALRGDVNKTPQEWGDLVRIENQNYSGSYPRLSVFHGKQDNVVNFLNSTEIVEQWSHVLGLDLQDRIEYNLITDVRQLDYFDTNNQVLITKYEIDSMSHALAVNPGNGVEEGGKEGQYGKDKDFFSSYWAAKFFGLIP